MSEPPQGPPPSSYPPPYPPPYSPPYPPQYPGSSYTQQAHWQGQPAQQWAPRPPKPSFPHSEPREYHVMYRTWNYSKWRPLVGIPVLLAGMIVVPILAMPILVVALLVQGGTADFANRFLEAGGLQEITPAGMLYLNLALFGMTFWAWGLIRLLHGMRPRWLTSVVPKMRWKFLLVCLGVSVVALIAQLVVSLLIPVTETETSGGVNSLTGTTIALGLVLLLTTPLQAAGEEYAFRGYLLQAFGSLTQKKWLSIVVTAFLFACAHLQFDPPLFFDRFAFGLVAAWLAIRTGGLEAGIAMHILNNLFFYAFALTFGDISSALDIGDVSWWNILVTLTQSLVYAGLVAWVASRMGVQTRTQPPSVPLSEGDPETGPDLPPAPPPTEGWQDTMVEPPRFGG